MVDVTAQIIARGADGRIASAVRQMARRLRDALTAPRLSRSPFEPELLCLHTERRKATLPGVAGLGLAVALVAAQWVSPLLCLAWLVLHAATVLCILALTTRPSGEAPSRTGSRARLLVVAETAQGLVWALIVLAAAGAHDPQATTFALVATLLVSAMSATANACLPSAVHGALAPVAIAIAIGAHGGTERNLPLTALALGTVAYFVHLARKQRQSALRMLSVRAEADDRIAALDLARRRAEDSNLAKSRFLATMSHELRTPLNAILGFAEIMKSELFGRHSMAVYKDYAADIHCSGEHVLMVVNDILDLSRVEAGRYELREDWVDLAAVVDDCRHLVALRADRKGIEIVREPAAGLPRLRADARALRQVALNLLSNAVKFTPPGGRVTIALGMSADGGQFVAVGDTGAGIPASEMDTIMSPFGRGALAQATAEEGTGLGLPIAKGLVDLHGGTFELTSEVGVGTRVTITFPPQRVMSIMRRIEAGAPLALRPAA